MGQPRFPLFRRSSRVVGWLERGGMIVAGVCFMAIVLITAVDVTMRYAFNAPLIWAFELISDYLMVAIFFLAIATTQRAGQNIGVDILARRLPGRADRRPLASRRARARCGAQRMEAADDGQARCATLGARADAREGQPALKRQAADVQVLPARTTGGTDVPECRRAIAPSAPTTHRARAASPARPAPPDGRYPVHATAPGATPA